METDFKQTIKYFKFIFALALVGMSHGSVYGDEPHRHETHPDFSKLKAYRTYIGLTYVGAYKHQFKARFTFNENHLVRLEGNSVDEIMALSKKDIQGVFGGLAPDHIKEIPAPSEIKPIEDAVRLKLKELYPGLSSLEIQYEGEARYLSLVEYLPISNNPDVFTRDAFESDASFLLKKGTNEFIKKGGGNNNDAEPICNTVFKNSCVKAPLWLPFTVSKSSKTGRSFLPYWLNLDSAKFSNQENAMDFELSRLKVAILNTLNEMDQGTYINPLEKMLKDQVGEIPAALETPLKFEIGCRAASEKKVRILDGWIGFSLSDLKNGFKTSGEFKELNLAIVFEVDMNVLKLEIRNNHGHSVIGSYKLSFPEVIKNDTTMALTKALIKLTPNPETPKQYDFPGDSQYSEYTCDINLLPGIIWVPQGSKKGFRLIDWDSKI